MAIKSIRLDPESEALLAEVMRSTGLTATDAFKAGLAALQAQLRIRDDPYAVYRTLDLGPGGYARAPASRAKQAVAEVIRGKLNRDPG